MGKENRKQKRINLNVEVGISHASKLQKLYSKNISKGGIYLTADKPIPVGKEVELSFYIKELDKEFKVRAVVLHVHTYETFEDESTLVKHYGMGLKFIDISAQDQTVIDSFITGKELKQGEKNWQ